MGLVEVDAAFDGRPCFGRDRILVSSTDGAGWDLFLNLFILLALNITLLHCALYVIFL